jgi:hypothetical protein
VGALQRFFRLTPSTVRKQSFTSDPFQRVDRDEIHVSEEASVLKSVIENEQIAQIAFLRHLPCDVPVRTHNDAHATRPLCDQVRLVSRLLPRDDRSVTRADNNSAGRLPFITARQHYRTIALVSETFSQENDKRRFASPADGEIADADDGMLQSIGLQYTALVQAIARADEESKSSAHRK